VTDPGGPAARQGPDGDASIPLTAPERAGGRVEFERRDIRGWEVLRLISSALVLEVVPALGGTITSLARRTDAAELLWSTPWGLRAHGSPGLPGTSEAQMVDTFPGGWSSVFPNGGDSANAHGAEWGYDGELRLTWLDWELQATTLTLTGRLARSPFAVTKALTLDHDRVRLVETVANVGRESVEVMWASKLNLGGALIGPDTVLDSAASVVRPDPRFSSGAGYEDLMPWPRSYGENSMINLRSVPGPTAGETRLAYLTDFTRPWISLTRPSNGLAVELTWDGDMWPYVWYSLEAGGRAGFPWYRAGYFLSLAPASSWPAHGLHDARRVSDSTVWMAPGGSRTSSLELLLTS
jgi:hypothetical protein